MPVQQESDLKRALQHTLTEQIIAIRQRRRHVEDKWLRNRRTWMGYPHVRYRSTDTNTSNFHIPAARRVIERAVVRGVKLLTPKVKWFEVQPSGIIDTDNRNLSNVDNFMWYLIRKKIKTRSIISQLVRSLMLYGMPILKTSLSVQNGMVYPIQRAVDPFSFYMYPETAATMDQAELVFEDFLFSYNRYQTFVDKGLVDPINIADLTKPDWPYHLVERMSYQGLSDPTNTLDDIKRSVDGQLERTSAAFVSITELWLNRDGDLYQAYIAWNVHGGARIVGFFKSIYDDPLYRLTVHRPLPGETYTTAQTEDIVELENVSGDMLRQFIDAVDREQGFTAFGGGGNAAYRKDQFVLKGGAKWDFGPDSPREVMQFIQPPVTSTNQLRAWQILNGYMQSMGGAGTIAEGQPGRNMPRSGQAVGSLIELSLADIEDFAQLIEQEVLTPGLSDLYKVAQLIPDDQLMRIPGGEALYDGGVQSNVLSKRDISGDYAFEWVGSLQFQDSAERAQRLMIFLNMAPQLMPLLEQQGYTFNLPELVKTIWRNGIGERSLGNIVVSTQEMAMQQQQTAQANGVPPEIMQMVQQVRQQQNGAQGGQPQSVPGLAPPQPTATPPQSTAGFVRQ